MMDGDSADSVTSEDAAPADVIDEAVATKEDGAESLLERTTGLRGPDRDPKLCLLTAQVRFSAALFRRLITDVAKSPHHDFAR